MKKIIFLLLIALSLFTTSCSRDEDELVSQPNYTFSFICYEEPIDVVQLEILDSNNNIINKQQTKWKQ